MSSGLSANTQDRKTRLAALKSLKRKQPSDHDTQGDTQGDTQDDTPTTLEPTSDSPTTTKPSTPEISTLLSGRNYDPTTRAPKLGFESDPSNTPNTLESRAQLLASSTKAEAEKDAAEDTRLDLFKLQPKKPNWDLKRDLDRKLEVLGLRTDNAVARLVRERISERRRALEVQAEGKDGEGDGEVVGMEGRELIEATHLREKEDEEDARREREADDDLLDAT